MGNNKLFDENYYELLAINKFILESKFNPNLDNDEFYNSPYIAKFANRAIELLLEIKFKKSNKEYQEWIDFLKINNRQDYLKKLELIVRRNPKWFNYSANNKKEYIKNLFAPFSFSELDITEFIDKLDSEIKLKQCSDEKWVEINIGEIPKERYNVDFKHDSLAGIEIKLESDKTLVFIKFGKLYSFNFLNSDLGDLKKFSDEVQNIVKSDFKNTIYLAENTLFDKNIRSICDTGRKDFYEILKLKNYLIAAQGNILEVTSNKVDVTVCIK